MSAVLEYVSINKPEAIKLPSSKSIANRLLIAQAISENQFQIDNLSTAKDTLLLKEALSSDKLTIDVGMAGTAFRFLTAYFSIGEGDKVLTGEKRMKQRPIKVLVDELKVLGADIEYLEKTSYPPLKISGRQLQSHPLEIDGSVSSQYISALLLIAPALKGGLQLKLINNIVSLPYIDLTIQLMKSLQIEVQRFDKMITVAEGSYSSSIPIRVEEDWSSASFFYQIATFTKRPIRILGLIEESIQGDKRCAELFESFGVSTNYEKDGILLLPGGNYSEDFVELDMEDCPDLIPSVAVVASQLVNKTIIHGVSTLRIKECDRVAALKNELQKIGVLIEEIGEHTLHLYRSTASTRQIGKIKFEVYNDHRMAMCFAPLAAIYDRIRMNDLDVVQKSFPEFWKEISKVGVQVKEE